MDKLTAVCIAVLVGTVVHANIERELWNAAKDGNLAYVENALVTGTNFNWRNQDDYGWGETALHKASQFNHSAVVRALLNAGADKDQRDDRGETPIFEASLIGSTDVVSILIHHGADVDISDKWGVTSLMTATYQGHLAIVEALIGAHANVSLSDNDGYTALHYAAGHNRPDIARLLLQKNADPKKQSNRGMTPGDLGRKEGFHQLASIIDGSTGANSIQITDQAKHIKQ